ncbi:MAG: sodium pump decarboxylase subunit gamma [Lachnospiraceae bacterium]|nr:sodium pump decarboxylase subunit gamma [Lachnospiraceae bacterium]
MKRLSKKLLAFLLVVISVMALSACSSTKESADSDVDPAMQESIKAQVENILNTLNGLSDEDIVNYKDVDDSFTVSAVTAYEAVKDELGTYTSIGDVEIEEDGDMITATTTAAFEQATATVTLNIDAATYAMQSLSMDVNYTLAQTLQRAGLNTLMGVGIVFVVLVFLSFIISLFRFIGAAADKSMVSHEAPKPIPPAPVQAPAAQSTPEETDDTELVAVIAAAIAASENMSTDSFVVRSIRKVNKTKWRNA